MTSPPKLTALFATAFGFCIAGCTITFTGIGLLVDSPTPPDSVEVAKSELKSVPLGGRLSLHLDDLSRRYGRFRGLGDITTEDYAALYESRRRDLWSEIRLPALGDSVTVAIPDGRSIKGQFIGFSEGCISLKTADYLKPVRFFPNRINSVETQDGNKIAATDLQELFVKEKIPYTTCVSLRTKSDTKAYPIDRIKAMWVIHPNNAWISGAIIGATVDLIVLAVIINELNNMQFSLGEGSW